MTFQRLTKPQLDYNEYRFGRARKHYRGPRPDLKGDYVACIGGAETFGRFATSPWPTELERISGRVVANLGQPGAGTTFFLKDPVVLEACSKARACIVSVTGAHLVSNRLFSVYPRRNQRLQGVSEMLEALYPEVDFGIYRFALNMLVALHRTSPDRFKVVEVELRNAWIARMRELLGDIETPKVLLWLSRESPDAPDRMVPMHARDTPPGFVTRQMVEAILSDVHYYVEYAAAAPLGEPPPLGEAEPDTVAQRYPTDAMHAEVARLLADPVAKLCDPSEA